MTYATRTFTKINGYAPDKPPAQVSLRCEPFRKPDEPREQKAAPIRKATVAPHPGVSVGSRRVSAERAAQIMAQFEARAKLTPAEVAAAMKAPPASISHAMSTLEMAGMLTFRTELVPMPSGAVHKRVYSVAAAQSHPAPLPVPPETQSSAVRGAFGGAA